MKTCLFNQIARLATFLVLGLTATAAQAQIIAFSNFSEVSFGTEGLTSKYWVDQAFIPDGSDYWATPLQSIAVKYSAQDVPVFAAKLYLGDIINKEVILTPVTDLKLQGVLSASSGTATFTSVNTALILDPGKTYWFAIELTSGAFSWDYVESLINSGSGSYPIGALAGYTSDAGEQWIHDSAPPQYPQYIEVTTAIPEPSTCVGLAGFSALLLAIWHRRRPCSRPIPVFLSNGGLVGGVNVQLRAY